MFQQDPKMHQKSECILHILCIYYVQVQYLFLKQHFRYIILLGHPLQFNTVQSSPIQHSPYLVNPLVRNDGERGGVVEDVVVLVLLPEGEVDVAEAVIEELVKVRPRPDHSRGQQVLSYALQRFEVSNGVYAPSK